MRNDIILDDWCIHAQADTFTDAFLESVFFSGNGRMGVRGYAANEIAFRPVSQGLFLAGMFDEIKPGITDFINLPTPVWHKIAINGMAPDLLGKVSYTLNLSCGLLTLYYGLDAGGAQIHVTEERFFDPERPGLISQRLSIRAMAPLELTVESGAFSASCNCPIPDDQVKENLETVQLMEELPPTFAPHRCTASYKSRTTNLSLVQEMTFMTGDGWCPAPLHRPEMACGFTFSGTADPEHLLVLDKFTVITTSRDKDPRIAPLPADTSWDTLLDAAKISWAKLWKVCAIDLDGDADAQTALRYLCYQMICNCSSRDDTVNIGARGLTHARYKGCYFWDTDLFMMPFYLYLAPTAARNLMAYRVNCLPAAKAYARQMSGAGARYPWMASYDGSEQCESWDIGASEVHITADVVYALNHYVESTGDNAFESEAYAVYIETARFWLSRYSPDPETGKVNLLFCKGPDEYCGITSNNLYTNFMVRHNLRLAIYAAKTLKTEDPQGYLTLGLTDGEVQSFQALHDAIKLPRDPKTGHWRTDDTFHLLEPVDLKAIKNGFQASYHNVCFDRLQRYQVVKQADVLLLMTRFPDAFTMQEKLDAWADFEPRCLHDSTLSFASHALFAAQNGLTAPALDYFEKALLLDLRDIMGNTGNEGLHMAGLGETWQAVVFGFAGLHFTENGPELRPQLPKQWKTLSFQFYWKGALYRADIGAGQAPCVTLVA